MKRVACLWLGAAPTRVALGLLAAVAVAGIPAQAASAQEGDAESILKAMADAVSRQESLFLKYDAAVGVVPPAIEDSAQRFGRCPQVSGLRGCSGGDILLCEFRLPAGCELLWTDRLPLSVELT